jgi:hypothetical protein
MDRTTKILLAVLAAGLWAHAAVPLIQRAHAQIADRHLERVLESVLGRLENIQRDFDAIAGGTCTNRKIC